MACLTSSACYGESVIDHRHTDITELTEEQITRAKAVLHIAYGHTSHGSQLTDGMSALVSFANGGGKNLALPANVFEWNNGGTGGALDLHDYAMGGDVGYYPDWVCNTTNYLNNPANTNVNVIIWSWCGQMDDKYAAGTLSNEYLLPMAELEQRYPQVVFVYMTGHVDIWDDADNKAACQAIRDYCIANNKVLYDFNDIEHYNPDGTYYEFVNDDCAFYASAGGAQIDNWATTWQDTHTLDLDWYQCSSAHSQPLNANQKAYAAWALWCMIAAVLDSDDVNVPPVIMTDPQSLIRNIGETASFIVSATGTAPLSYQWQKNGANISSANSATYTINQVAAGDEGNYRCLVTNMAGTTTSAVAVLTVNVPPVITTDPQSLIRNVGETASLIVSATGTAPLSYQWQKNGANISSANSATYTINPVAAGDEGNYRCLVTNMAGTATSAVAVLTVNAVTPPNPSSTPTDVSASDGTYTNKIMVTWKATSGATSYQVWRHTINNSCAASKISSPDPTGTSYDDMNATVGITYYYWAKAVSAAGASSFSMSDSGFLGVVGPLITANGLVGAVPLNSGEPVAIAVQMMNIDPYLGTEVDWLVVSLAESSWYYLNNLFQWTEFDGSLSNCHPSHQGGLFNLPVMEVLNILSLATGSYTFWFAVDYPMDGIFNLDGLIWLDSVNVIVQ